MNEQTLRSLPGPEVLAGLVSEVMQTMFSIGFGFDEPSGITPPWRDTETWRTLGVPIAGGVPVVVIVASDRAGATRLATAMFDCPQEDVDGAMIDDALGELVNIVAGQLKPSLGPDRVLGLPQVLMAGAGLAAEDAPWRAAFLSTRQGDVRVWVAIREQENHRTGGLS